MACSTEVYIEDEQDRLLSVARIEAEPMRPGQTFDLAYDGPSRTLEVVEVLEPGTMAWPDYMPAPQSMVIVRAV